MRRGQAAMEFLMTYGWAIMVVLVAIGALAYFGVLNVGNRMPDSCIFGSGLSCRDFILKNGTATGVKPMLNFSLVNNMGEGITVYAINATSKGVNGSCAPTNTLLEEDTELRGWCNFTMTVAKGDGFKAKVTIIYARASGIYNHTLEGDITVRAQP